MTIHISGWSTSLPDLEICTLVPDVVCEAILAHASPGVKQTYYRHTYAFEKREAERGGIALAKRRKPDPDFIDPWLLEAAEKDAGLGVSTHFLDRAFWLPEYGPDAPWYIALEKLDSSGDKKPLLDLFKSDQELSPIIRHHIADLLERYTLKRPAGKQATPSYDFSGTNVRLWLKIDAMRSDVENRQMSVEDAAEKYATNQFPVETLIDAYQGKHGGFARALAAKHPKREK
jgi:hypothetical protein